MKKLLGSTLALAMFLPAGANAELLKNFKASGSIDIAATSANNITDLRTDTYDRRDNVQTRVIVSADWDLLDDVHSKVTLRKNNRAYGRSAAGTNTSEDLNTVQSNVFVDQANIKIDKLFGALDATLGRQFFGEAGDLVIYAGPRNDYGLTVTALDGGRFDWNGEKLGVTLLAAKLSKGTAGLNVTDNADVNLGGLNVTAKPMDDVSGSAYVYGKHTINNGGTVNVVANDHLYVAGLRAKAMVGGAWIKAEFDKNFGSNRTVDATATNLYSFTGSYTGWAGLVDVGYKADLSDIGAIAGWAEGGVGSAGKTSNRGFQAIAGDYRPGSIAGRFWSGAESKLGSSNSIGTLENGTLNNRVVLGVGVKVTPAALNKLTAGLSWWNFRAQNATALHIASATDTKGNKFLGNEYDLDLNWAHSENVSVSAGVGSFQPGRAYIVTNGTVSPATVCYGEAHVKF